MATLNSLGLKIVSSILSVTPVLAAGMAGAAGAALRGKQLSEQSSEGPITDSSVKSSQ